MAGLIDPAELRTQVDTWIDGSRQQLAAFRDRPESFEDAIARARDLQRLLWDEGWSRWGWPGEVGGRGGSVRHRAVLYEALNEAGIAVPEPFQIVEVVGPALLEFAPHIAHEHLEPCLSGAEVWTLGFSEPGSGSDLASVRTQLTAGTSPGEFRLSGQKTWNGLGHLAEYSLVLCRSPGAEPGGRDLTMAFVQLAADGVTTRPIRAMNGRNEFAEIFFDDVRVQERDLVGGTGVGWKVIAHLMQYERGTYAWPRQARLHRLLDELLSSDRCVGLDASRLGRLYLDLVGLRLKCRESLRLLAESVGSGPGHEASIDKLLLVRAETTLVTLARDCLYPAIEVGDDEEAQRWRHDFLYARALAIFGGTNEIQRNIVAERVLGMPRERLDG